MKLRLFLFILIMLLNIAPNIAFGQIWDNVASSSVKVIQDKKFFYIENNEDSLDQKAAYNIQDYAFISDTTLMLRIKNATTTSTSTGYYLANIKDDHIFIFKNIEGLFTEILKHKIKTEFLGTTTPLKMQFSATSSNPTNLNFQISSDYQVLENHFATDSEDILEDNASTTLKSAILITKAATSSLKISTTTFSFYAPILFTSSSTFSSTTIGISTSTASSTSINIGSDLNNSSTTPALFSVKKSHTLEKLEDNLKKIEKEIEKEKKKRLKLENDLKEQVNKEKTVEDQ